MTITQIAHVTSDGSFVLLEQAEAGVTTSISEKWNQSEGTGLLRSEVRLSVSQCEFVRTGNANVSKLKATPAFDVITYFHIASAQVLGIQDLTSFGGSILGSLRGRLRHGAYRSYVRKKVALLL